MTYERSDLTIILHCLQTGWAWLLIDDWPVIAVRYRCDRSGD